MTDDAFGICWTNAPKLYFLRIEPSVYPANITKKNAPTSQAASTERIWSDRLEEGALPAEEEDVMDVEDDLKDKKLEKPGRASTLPRHDRWC
ncbi:unnamed protein product [Schistocephalus solidus]|uniref:Uncharacterized protein n=1 Tax=Schistocephalus solidus TaxID=70667 RepID=A0A183TF25_SCHSO|nr:unnamed protein product [Schistocephalus solidus]